ncbi:MAG: ECF-type sigma factor [Planctomycetota bacterium]
MAEPQDPISPQPPAKLDAMFESVMAELRVLAGQMMGGERGSHTLQPTALVNEAFVRLCRKGGDAQFNDKNHFFQVAAMTLRRLLVEHARSRGRKKRGGGGNWKAIAMDDADAAAQPGTINMDGDDLLAIEEAMQNLAGDDPRLAKVVELRFFGGLTMQQIAQALGVAERTVYNDWRFAQAKLKRALQADLDSADE